MSCKSLLAVLLLSVSILFSGCATIFSGSKANINVREADRPKDSNPVKAKIFVNGNYMGDAPAKISISKSQLKPKLNPYLEIRAEGYKTIKVQLSRKAQAGWLILDIITGLDGLVVDWITGNINTANPKQVRFVLEKL
jgi:hypothetical protein